MSASANDCEAVSVCSEEWGGERLLQILPSVVLCCRTKAQIGMYMHEAYEHSVPVRLQHEKTGALGRQPVMYSAIQHGPILHPSTPLKPGT